MPSTFFCVLKGIELRVFYTFNAPENYTVQNVIDHIHQACHEERPIIYHVYNEMLGRIQEVQLGDRLFPRDALASQVFDEYNILFVPNEGQEAEAEAEEDESENEEQPTASFFDPVLANIAASLTPRAAHFMSLDEMFVLAENMSYFNILLGGSGVGVGVADNWGMEPPPPPPPDSVMATTGIEVKELDRQYPVFLHREQEQEQEQASCCCICLEAYEKEDVCRKMVCAHVFHQTCIDRWLSRHTQCPVCRAECGF